MSHPTYAAIRRLHLRINTTYNNAFQHFMSKPSTLYGGSTSVLIQPQLISPPICTKAQIVSSFIPAHARIADLKNQLSET